MFCPKCGKELSDTSKFCGNCGYKLEKKAAKGNRVVLKQRNPYRGL